MAISGTQLYSVVLGGAKDKTFAVISDLKAHVKKDNVDLSFVPKYFESLSIVLDTNDSALQTLAFSLVCHLVKRVSIQDKKAEVLAAQSFLVLPILIPRIADSRSSIKLAARKALEAYWLSSPSCVDQAVIEIGLGNRSLLLVNECVVWLNHIVSAINPHFKLDPFLHALAQVLAKHTDDVKLVANVKILLENYYELKHNRIHKYELHKVLEANNVDPHLRSSIMGTDSVLSAETLPTLAPFAASSTLDSTTRSEYKSSLRPSPSTSFPASEIKPSGTHSKHISPPEEPESFPAPLSNSVQPSSELEVLLSSLTGFKDDTSMQKIDMDSPESIDELISEMMSSFSSKETEKNWSLREKNILQLRGLCRGNAMTKYCTHTLFCIKEVADGICKCLLSLRTTLSVNACQLVKELALTCGSAFDSAAEMFMPTLIKLSSSTKFLAHSNSHVAMSAILSQCTINGKILQRLTSTAFEKSVNTKSYAGFWLSVVLLRSSTPLAPSVTEVADKMLIRLLADPNMQVRQSAKDAFWRYYSISSSSAEHLQSKLDNNIVKALERSKPAAVAKSGPLSNGQRKTRPSIKDSIIAKNKELRSKQIISRSNSRLRASSAMPSLESSSTFTGEHSADHNEPNRMTKHFSEPPNLKLPINNKSQSWNRPELRKEPAPDSRASLRNHDVKMEPSDTPHYAQLTYSQRNLSLTAPPQAEASHRETPRKRDTREVFDPSKSISPNIKTPTRSRFTDPYNNSNDPITKFLSSSQEELMKEGVKLLKYAVLGGEEFSPEVMSLLHRVSISKPLLMGIIVNDSEKLLRKSRKLFSPEDFIRVCAINREATEENINLVLSLLAIDEVYDAIELLLSFISDLDNIIEDKLLAMQIIKYKSSILSSLLKLSIRASFKIPITDIKFTKLVSSLFELVPVIHQTQLIDEYQTLLRSLYAINTVLFVSQLSSASRSIKREIDHLVGIDNVLEYKNTDMVIPNVSELTQVAPGMEFFKFSPLKNPTDFTMLFPSQKPEVSPSHQDKALHSDTQASNTSIKSMIASKKTEVQDMVEVAGEREHLPHSHSENDMSISIEPAHEAETNLSIHNEEGSVRLPEPEEGNPESAEPKTDLFSKFNSDSSSELVEDFAQVRLSNRANTIETFIEKVDPLNKISSRNKPISIFEDNRMGSPQKVSQYSYTNLNWFNFSIAKIALDQAFIRIDDFSIHEYELLCGEFRMGEISESRFAVFMKYLQVPESHEFYQYLSQEGFQLGEQALWKFVSSPNPDPFNALMVLKQLLVCRYSLNLDTLWGSLVQISQMHTTNSHHALSLAVEEAFEEALCGLYPSTKLFSFVIKALGESEVMSEAALDFNLASLYKLVSSKSLVLTIDKAFVQSIDDVLYKYIGHSRVEVRKVVIETYGKLLRAARMSYSDAHMVNDSKDVMFSFMRQVTEPQRRMIEYFSA